MIPIFWCTNVLKHTVAVSVADDCTAALKGADIKLMLGFLLNPFQSTTTQNG